MTLTPVRPNALATVEQIGDRKAVPREHLIKIVLKVGSTPGNTTGTDIARIARQSLAPFGATADDPHRPAITEIPISAKLGSRAKPGAATVIIGVECTAVCSGRPADDSVESVRASLVRDGYRVAVQEKRECAEASCHTAAMVSWGQVMETPPGWYSNRLCGGHNYRTCRKCKSTFRLTSTNAAGQGPSVHCEVCGLVLVEWGSSKLWNAELIERGQLV